VYDDQDRVAAGERPTDGYTMLNAALTYRLPANGLRLEAFLRASSLSRLTPRRSACAGSSIETSVNR
jgi:hypothetical protein